MKVHFGPELHHHIKQALYYATHLAKDQHLDRFIGKYDQDDNNLFTYFVDGVLELENMRVEFRRTDKVHSTDHALVAEVYGYFEAETIDIIQNFFERAETYTNNLVCSKKSAETIKILKF